MVLVDVAWHTWNRFWTTTAIVGASNAGRAQSGARKAVWFVVFLAGVACTVYAVALVISDYMGFPVETAVSLVFADQVLRNAT